MNISTRNDYSYLFNSMNSKAANSNGMYGINLSDYSSIKSGGYGKLMKAYYSTAVDTKDDSGKTSNSKDILSKLTEARKPVEATDKTDTDKKTDATASTAASETKVSSAKDYLDTILESSKQLYASNGAYNDASAAIAGATLDTAV